jgi:hypothetical protein
MIALRGRDGYFGDMNKRHIVVGRWSDFRSMEVVPGTPAQRIGMVWPLTREVASLSGNYNVKQRLQRHIARLGRRES